MDYHTYTSIILIIITYFQGQYLMNNANFEIDAAVFSQGDYRIKVMVMAKGKQVFCIDMTASVSSG